jgi:hypothetical protein
VRWSYPATTTAGEVLTDVEGVEVWRATLPKGQEPPPAVSPQDRQLRRQLLESQGEIVVTLDPDALRAATHGRELVYRDDLEQWRRGLDGGGESTVVWYGVRTICCRKQKSELSNVARLVPAEAPPPPTDLHLEAGADGIDLQWTPAPELKTRVERSPDGALWTSVTDEPVAGGSWRDSTAAQGSSWSYRLRSVAAVNGGGQVVGDPSPPQRVDHPDTYPPPPPGDVVCLPEGALVRVRWAAVPGAREYVVSRRGSGGAAEELATAVESTELVDPAPPLGEIVYLVAAKDGVGNTSAASTCTVVMGAVP